MYKRPHRVYIVQREYVCPDCERPCQAIECDSGIGPGEFWGAKFNDTHPYIGSDCCEAVVEDAEFDDDYYDEG